VDICGGWVGERVGGWAGVGYVGGCVDICGGWVDHVYVYQAFRVVNCFSLESTVDMPPKAMNTPTPLA
jgi:hypothetical protein